jgi:CheY-like chemotaxis protein
MVKINKNEYIEELLDDIHKKDVIKAKILLRHIDQVDDTTQRRLIFELNKADDDFSLPLLIALIMENPGMAVKVPTFKQILIAKFLADPDALIQCFQDFKSKECDFFVEVAGEMKLQEAVEPLTSMLKEHKNKNKIILLLDALGNIASPESTNIISDHLYSGSKDIVIAAIKALSKIATPTAIQRLAERTGTDNEFDALIFDVFASVQDQLSLEKLNDSLVSHYAFIRNLGKTKLIEVGSKAVPLLIENLKNEDPDLLIHTLNILGDIGDTSAIAPIKKLLFREPTDPNVRFAAYEALGRLPLDKGIFVLAGGLTDPIDNVCMAAAKAINKNFNEVLSAGINNLFNDKSSDKDHLIRMIIDSEADRIFMEMLHDDFFKKYSMTYLKRSAHKDVRNYFCKVLENNNFSELAKTLKDKKEDSSSNKKKICVVDDSRMILSVYRSTLHNLGFEADLFEFPKSAIEALLFTDNKPDLVITDLNMPDITGVEMTRKVREKYSAKQLPIIMVTTQHEVQDNQAAYKAGVDLVIHKPFTEDSLGEAISRFIK